MSEAALIPESVPGASLGGPVSEVLEADVRTWVRRKGIVVWLDVDDKYSSFVDRLGQCRREGSLSYEVRALRGSYLALMLELEGLASGTEPPRLLIHLPGLTEEGIRNTPLLELYFAGYRYRKALDTIVTEAAAGRVLPEQIDAFRRQPHFTLAEADAWLGSLLIEGGAGIARQLRAMKPAAVFDDLLRGGFIAEHIRQIENASALWERLASWTGLPTGWRNLMLPSSAAHPEDIAFAAASWALCVEYASNPRRETYSNPHLAMAVGLRDLVGATCSEIAAHLRERHSSFYKRTADEMEDVLSDEMTAVKAEDLGPVDTFRFQENKALTAALEALEREDWTRATSWSLPRVGVSPGALSIWLRDDPARASTWQLIRDAAHLGQALSIAGPRLDLQPTAINALEGALEAYEKRGAAVDRAHRHLEQRRLALLDPQIPEFDRVRARLDGMRRAWRQWADAWASDFNALCRAQGFLPSTSLQQRTLFDEVVKPLAQEAGTTAYFVVDALRFEMGQELFQQLEGTPGTTLQLRSRLAELPTVTEVGMNVLAPLSSNGRLAVVMSGDTRSIQGFRAGEFRVSDPDSRRRAMHARVGGNECGKVTLDEVTSLESAQLKRKLSQSRLIMVHSTEIDNAGEQGVGPVVFDHVLQKLKAAWRILRDLGVRRFVMTSDHGFLLLDESASSVVPHGRRSDPHRRYVFSPVAADHAGEVRVSLADLGYDGAVGNLMMPDTTAVFDTGRRSLSTFVHGGNSLQERVIPVLTVLHRTPAGGSSLKYEIKAEAKEAVAGMLCLQARVDVLAQQGLDFGTAKEIELALHACEGDAVKVEICQIRGNARLIGAVIVATVAEDFELFFRLTGPSDARVRVELHHPSKTCDIRAGGPETRFPVMANPALSQTAARLSPAITSESQWLQQLLDVGARKVFQHLAVHGTVTETEAAAMLGGPRGLRRFSNHFEEWAKVAPFTVRIDVVGGVKRYVREGGG